MSDCCFHCGEPMPAGERRTVQVNGEPRPVCCAGCEAVANLIAGNGLEDFYRYRTAPSSRPDPGADSDEWYAYDRQGLLEEISQDLGDEREAIFALEGITCAACAWLIERVLAPLPGVTDVQVNPATGRLLLRWRPAETGLSIVLRRLAEIGYRAHPVEAGETVPAALREKRAMLRRLAVAGLGMMQVMMYAVGLYAGAIHADMDPDIHRFLRLVSLLVATPVVVYAGAPFFRGALRDLRNRRPGMDVPVALAIGGAYGASVWNTLIGHGEVYFDSATMFVFFLTVARALEMAARHRAGRASLALARTLPATALRIGAGDGGERVGLAELMPGDRVRVRTGETVPADGTILRGRGGLDESLITGEFQPVTRGPGDGVLAGSVNRTGVLEVRVDRVGRQTLVSSIAGLLERAQTERPRLARLADRVASAFVSVVLVATAIIAGIWWWHRPDMAFEIALAVLVATCPCALSLATPTGLVAATSAMARRGLLVARTDALEVLARVDRVVLDKTGTLTTGEPALRGVETNDRLTRERALALAAALEAHSEHPIARAFVTDTAPLAVTAVSVEAGAGVIGEIEGRRYRLGRADWALGTAASYAPDGVILGDDTGLLATFTVHDPVREEGADAVEALHRRGITTEVLSGDTPSAVSEAAAAVGAGGWRARMRPDDKLARLRARQERGERVAMVGDGINDAPVLAGADVSVAMGRGSALARNSADMVLMREDLHGLVDAVDGARRTIRIIRQNLVWAAAYNLTALPLAATGVLTPWMAAIGMSASSLVVVANALRAGHGGRDDRGLAGAEAVSGARASAGTITAGQP
ncbi:heavy metal translocating P-type ATPase [Arhodomonas sp. SL1]|uniref:heavy metal translocating P-type ATPase n=1 Tax=Arhodomonas sp. SL1 TaxID=3425691 RepID=UPI003F8816D8